MGTFTSHIPRDVAKTQGIEVVSIGEIGYYHTHSGCIIDLKHEIAHAARNTISYPPDLSLMDTYIGEYATNVEITNETTLSAATRLIKQGLKTVVLNFASATSPGGGFLNGARAQEE